MVLGVCMALGSTSRRCREGLSRRPGGAGREGLVGTGSRPLQLAFVKVGQQGLRPGQLKWARGLGSETGRGLQETTASTTQVCRLATRFPADWHTGQQQVTKALLG